MIGHPGAPVVVFVLAVLGGLGAGLFAGGVHADWVVLQNGGKLEGELVDGGEESESVVRLKVSGGTITLPRSAIRSLGRGEPEQEGADGRKRVAHKGGAGDRPRVFRYLDGSDVASGEVVMAKFTVLVPVGELAHGTLVEVIESARFDDIAMARVRVGELEGWLPARWLRETAVEPPIVR